MILRKAARVFLTYGARFHTMRPRRAEITITGSSVGHLTSQAFASSLPLEIPAATLVKRGCQVKARVVIN